MEVYYGTVHGNTVVLPEDVPLKEGARVEVRLLPAEGQTTEAALEEAFKQRLVALGMLKEIKRPPKVEPPGDRTPARIEGKPLSQIVIEDRR